MKKILLATALSAALSTSVQADTLLVGKSGQRKRLVLLVIMPTTRLILI